jgi:hypothetical protein
MTIMKPNATPSIAIIPALPHHMTLRWAKP